MNESINNNKINRSSPFDNNFDQTTEADNKTHEQIADCCATDDDDKSQDCTMVKSSKENKKLKSQLPSDSEVLALMGDATTAIFLLRNYDKFGLAERVCYHFDLTEALTASEESNSSNGDEVHPSTCGVVSLLECAVLTPWQKLLKRQRRALKNEILGFNMAAAKVHRERPTACYQPKKLPLRFNPSTRMFFAYEVTRIAFCVDASYSLTSTFGVGGSSNNPCCPLDRLPEMARTFFNSLVLPVPASSMTDPGVWKPVLSVTVIAVFPGKTSETSLLVRDYRVHNVESSEILANRINEWIHSEVEFGISERMCRHTANAWGIPLFSSSLRDILEVGDYCLSVLSSEAKPVIVVATDCRSVSCDGIVDVFLDINRVDAPVVILDLSIPETHSMEEQPRQALAGKNELNFLTYDPGGPSAFPLHLSDDSEALYGICRATGGCFLDFNLLTEGSKSVAGQNPVTETAYHYTFKRRFVKMNGVQWLVLFSLSPLSPTFHSAWAKLAPPEYLRKRLNMGMVDAHITTEGQNALHFSRHDNYAKQGSDSVNSPGPSKKLHTHSRVTCSIYVVSPIRIKALLLMRIKEGYRARQYGLSTQDADKVFIQFTLPLELGTVLHYELQYKALSSQNHMIGSAHIKIELSGDKGFIQSVKKDFLRQVPPDRPFTMAQKVSARLCQVLKWIRTEDCLQSYICPPSRWSDQLSSSGTPFVKRLGSMTKLQRRRHFQFDEFDVICTGRIPYTLDDDFLSEFIAVDSGEHELMDQISGWATQAVQPNSIYVKSLSTLEGMTAYCLIEIVQSPIAPRLFSMSVQFYGGTDPSDRHGLVNSFKNALRSLKSVSVLAKQMGPYLLGGSKSSFWKKRNVEIQHHHERWDLLKDSELLPLVMKRRMDLGNFLLLQSNDDLALFAKLAPEDLLKNKQGPDTHKVTSPGDLIQYQFESLSDKVVVDLHMESECGTFFPFRVHGNEASRFNALVQKLRQRDQECGRALRSRTNLLRVFQAEDSNALEQVGAIEESHRSSVSRILAYSSKVSRRLRFFNGAAGTANDILAQMTENLLLSNSFGVQAAKLDLDPNELIKDEDTGLWFIIKFDRHTMSIVHLSSVDKKGGSEASESQTYRDLTFFTNGIGDLYSKRDDMVDDDDSADSHISEYLCVTEFADHFEIAQKENFAAAAYLSLRNDGQLLTESFDKGDFAEVLRTCEFVEVTSVSLVGVESSDHENPMIIDQSKLYLLINTIFRLVPGDEQCMFYCGYGNVEELLSMGGDESDSTDSMNASIDLSLDNPSADDDGHFGNDDDSDGRSQLYKRIVPPIFVRFQLDGEQASLKDLHQISRSATLAAQMSVFKNERTTTTPPANAGLSDLPWSHQVAAIELTALLKSYVAEQTIERLRHHGSSISDENLCQVQRCLKRVRSVVSFSIEVYFYVSKTNLMVPASAPAGGESEVEEGFLLLNSELRNNGAFELRPVPGGGFVVVSGKDRIDEALEFWCFVYVQKSDGIVSSQLYHRDGEEKAMMVMSKIHDVVCVCVHRANQQLLLKRLHGSRTASQLLIPEQGAQIIENPEYQERDPSHTFIPGVFSCPIVFRTTFDLYHRCAANPGQVAHKLEATVLHSFAVSNRQGIFVYKDEGGQIFYMSLQAKGSGLDDDGKVELLVHGIHKPGPSVTKQLRRLLQRRLLLIAVDMLSSVLTKNPHFNWKNADFEFLKSFEKDWLSVDEDKHVLSDQDCFYEFPVGVNDPCMVLVMFRQNLCGSTFFHRLIDVGYDGQSPPIIKSHSLDSGATVLKWNKHDFTLYYNNAPSNLDPSFQGVSTLTDKGAYYSRQAGTGIAMLEISLVRSNGEDVDELCFGEPATSGDNFIEAPLESLRFRKLTSLPDSDKNNSICLRVRVTDTALNREYLHEWIALTLNQALVGWETERLIERSSRGLIRPFQAEACEGAVSDEEELKEVAKDRLCPGLPALTSILESSRDLPHPAITKVLENNGVIRSSSVATTTLELLENCILTPIFADSNLKDPIAKARNHMCILRLTRFEKPKIVQLAWDALHRKAIVNITSSKSVEERTVDDSPIDCPEYICFFCLSQHDGQIDAIDPHLQLYQEVMLVDGSIQRSSSVELLQTIKKSNPTAFFRSFAFVFSVKRNRDNSWSLGRQSRHSKSLSQCSCLALLSYRYLQRTLWAYNWNPQLAKSILTRLQESSILCIREAGRSAYSLQSRTLRILSPATGFKEMKQRKKAKLPINDTPKKESEPLPIENKQNRTSREPGDASPPPRRIRRPVSIRRPKLVGKSVEGAAMQAVAASRKRASSNQFKNVGNAPLIKRPPTNQNVQDSTKASIGRPPIGKADQASKIPPHPLQTVRNQREHEERDETLLRAKDDFKMLCSIKHGGLRRLSALQRGATIMLANVWWPRKQNQTIPSTVAKFIVSKTPMAWSDACAFPLLPGETMVDMFVPVFSRWITTFTPGLEILPLVSTKASGTNSDSVFLSSGIRNVRGCKCLAVVKITKTPSRSVGHNIVRCEGWVLNLPRRSVEEQRSKLNANSTSLLSLEKDSAGMDKLTSDLHGSLVLESLLFDFSASMVERAVRLLDVKIDFKDLVPTVRGLMSRYSLERQKRMPMLNYRAFEATIVLKSYKDRLVDMFDSTALFHRMYVEAETRDMIRCGAALCFKQGISVKGCHSICFLTVHPTEVTKMQLVILCRTQGRNLSDFMFRENSNIAIHILDNIALEAAGLAYKELKFVSEKLLKDALWKSFSSKNTLKNARTTDGGLRELLTLANVRPLNQILGNSPAGAVPEIATLFGSDSGIDWLVCCAAMKQDPSFSPSWQLEEEDNVANIFFIEPEDIFLLLKVDPTNNSLLEVDLVERDDSVSLERRQITIQRFLNFALHFVWFSL